MKRSPMTLSPFPKALTLTPKSLVVATITTREKVISSRLSADSGSSYTEPWV